MIHLPAHSSAWKGQNGTEQKKWEPHDYTMGPLVDEMSDTQSKGTNEAEVDNEIFQLLAEAGPSTSHQSFEDISDFIEQRSITYRMFRNEYAASTKSNGNRVNPNAKNYNKSLAPEGGKRPYAMYYVPLPLNRSLFTIDEMRDLFAVFTASEGNGPNPSQILTYSQNMANLKVENTEFLSVVKRRWTEDQWSRTTVVKEGVADFVAKWWKVSFYYVKTCVERCVDHPSDDPVLLPTESYVTFLLDPTFHSWYRLGGWAAESVFPHSMRDIHLCIPVKDYGENGATNRIPRVRKYPQTYKELSSISLTPSKDQVKLQYLKTLHSYGRPPRYYSNPNVRVSRPAQAPGLIEEMTNNEIFYGQDISRDDMHKELSQDANAEKLALEYQVQLVLTPSVLATLLANNPLTYEECWCIPFVVREYQIDVKKDAPGEHTRKIIYLDKKFAPQALTPVQKNWIYAKHAVRMIHLQNARTWDQLIKETPSNEVKIEPEEELHDSKITGKLMKRNPSNEEVKSEIDEGEENPIRWNDPVKTVEEGALLTKAVYQKQVYYNLWECSVADPASVLSKHHKKPFKILVRTPVRGQIPPKKNPTIETDYTPKVCCTLLPKLDFQPEYGAQVASFSEIAKEWAHIMIRPNSVLHRVRVDPVRGNTIMTEPKTAVDLAHDCIRIHSRCIQNQLSILQNLVDAVGTLPPGNYLLNHQVKDHGFMFVYHERREGDVDRNSCSRSNMNLWELYDGVDPASTTAPQSSPWVPLDTGIITPTFHTLGRIPCVFAPVKSVDKKRKFMDDKPARRRNPKPNKKKKPNNNKLTAGKKKSGAAGAAAADEASPSNERKPIPYHDVDAVTDDY